MTADVKEAKSTAPHRGRFEGYSKTEKDQIVGLRPDSEYYHSDIGGDGRRAPIDEVALVGGLLRPEEAYPWRLPVVELVKTHVSWIFLAGDWIVKAKR